MQPSGYEPDNSDAETQLVGGAAQPPHSPDPAAPGAGQPPVPPTAVAPPYPPAGGTYPPGYPAAQPPAPGTYDQQQYPAPPSYPGQGYPQQPGYGTPAPGYGTPTPDYGQQPGYDYSQGQQAYPGYPQPGYGTPAPGYDYSQQPGYAPQPGYGPGYPGAPQPPGNNNRRNLIIGAVAAGVVVVILIIVLAVTLSGGGGKKPTPSPTASVSPTAAPSTSVPTTAPTTTAPTVTPTGLSANEQALVNQLDSTSMTNCDPAPDQENADIQAAVLCTSNDGRGVYAFSYVNKSALDHDVSFYSNSINTDGDCKNGKDQVTTWSYDNQETDQGALLCSHTPDGNAYIRWYYDDQLLGFFATDQDGVALYSWWRNFEAVQN